MKTVQEWLKTVDEERLIREYIESNNMIRYEEYPDQKVSDLQEKAKELLREYLQRMKAKPLARDTGNDRDSNDDMVFVAMPYPDEDLSGNWTNLKPHVYLCEIDAVLKEEKPEEFGWTLSTPETIFGWYIAETDYTIRNIYNVLSQIIWEATWHGYGDNDTQDYIDEIESENREYKVYTAEEFMALLDGEFDDDDDEEDEDAEDEVGEFELPLPLGRAERKAARGEDDTTDEFEKRIWEIGVEYREYLYKREVSKVREILQKNC